MQAPRIRYGVRRLGLQRSDCQFYHTIDVLDYGLVIADGGGKWDLRPFVGEMLKGIVFDGRSVLEVGPASGFLTIEMEKRGAKVTAVEAPYEHAWDIVPFPGCRERWADAAQKAWLPCTNSWWFTHEHSHSKAQIICLSADEISAPTVGRYDISLMSNVLLHNRDPLRILTNCADCTDESIVIIEQFNHDLEQIDQPLCRLDPVVHPAAGEENWNVWWRFNRKLFVNYLTIMGFKRFDHQIFHVNWGDVPIPMFTLTGHRT